jgi:hypothetical protein
LEEIVKHLAVLLLLGVAYLKAQTTPQVVDSVGDDQRNKPAKVEGKVLNSVSAVPIGKVKLTLRSLASTRPSKYVVTSDAEGIFVFDHVEPGRYTLSAEKPGFLEQIYGPQRTTPLTVSEGQLMKEILFQLTPQGVISGKVTDQTGEPMHGVQVMVMQRGYWKGKRVMIPGRGTFTNDTGEYRIANLRPGSYYLQARWGDLMAGVMPFSHADAPSAVFSEKPEEGYAATYYPSSLDPTGAVALQVTPGGELRDIEIQARKTRVFRVRGQVIDSVTGQALTDARVMLTPTSGDYRMMWMISSMGGPRIRDGNFEVSNVLPGSYYATAEATINGQTSYARQSVYVGDRNVTDVVIGIPRAIDVRGRVRMSGQEPPTPPEQQSPSQQTFRTEKVGIDFIPAEGFGVGEWSPAAVNGDGSFVLRNVVPDKYRIYLLGMPPGAYLKSIRVGGPERPDGIVELSGGSFVDIVLAMGAAQVTGSVVEADDKPAPGATVTLVPDDVSKQQWMDLFRNATSDQNGKFHIDGVVPGRYKVFAWQENESDAAQDPEFLRPFESKASAITLDENGRETTQLKAISAEDVAKAFGNL